MVLQPLDNHVSSPRLQVATREFTFLELLKYDYFHFHSNTSSLPITRSLPWSLRTLTKRANTLLSGKRKLIADFTL